MKRLIINADDLGVNSQRSHGIFQCMEFGVVSSTSLYPNGTDSDAAAKHARERGVSVGLHLNLTEEFPLSKRETIESILEGNGMFMEPHRLEEALNDGEVEPEHLSREIRTQVEWFFDTCGYPTHINSHHHMHLHPMIATALMPIMERYGLSKIRIPYEMPIPPFGYVVPEEQVERVAKMNEKALIAKKIYAGNGFETTDHFRGMCLAGNASIKNIKHIISKLPDGTTELMVHPGSAITYGTKYDLDPQRQTELRMLLDDVVKEFIAEKGVELVGWDEI